MRKFLLFAGDHYYPSGGVGDLVGAFPDFNSAVAAYWWGCSYGPDVSRREWGHVLDVLTLDVVDLEEQKIPPVCDLYSKPEMVRQRRRRRRRSNAQSKKIEEAKATATHYPEGVSEDDGIQILAAAFELALSSEAI